MRPFKKKYSNPSRETVTSSGAASLTRSHPLRPLPTGVESEVSCSKKALAPEPLPPNKALVPVLVRFFFQPIIKLFKKLQIKIIPFYLLRTVKELLKVNVVAIYSIETIKREN